MCGHGRGQLPALSLITEHELPSLVLRNTNTRTRVLVQMSRRRHMELPLRAQDFIGGDVGGVRKAPPSWGLRTGLAAPDGGLWGGSLARSQSRWEDTSLAVGPVTRAQAPGTLTVNYTG